MTTIDRPDKAPPPYEWEVYGQRDERRAVLYRGRTQVAVLVGRGLWLRARMTWVYWAHTGRIRGFTL